MQSQKENQRTSVKNSHVISQAKPHFSKNKQKENLGKQQFCVNLIYLPKKCTQMGKFQPRNSKKLSWVYFKMKLFAQKYFFLIFFVYFYHFQIIIHLKYVLGVIQ